MRGDFRPRNGITAQQEQPPELDDATRLLEKQIENLEVQKKLAVRDEDYALAKQLKLEIERLRRQLAGEGEELAPFDPSVHSGGLLPVLHESGRSPQVLTSSK